jgi:tRNA (guanine-N7-)-methyltransferase
MRDFNAKNIPTPRLTQAQVEQLQTLFLSSKEVDLEIGCGVGWHPLQYQHANPQRNLIACERTKDKYQSFAGRYLNHSSPSNLVPLHCDAIGLLQHFIPENSLSQIFLMYPNPEPKNPAQRWFLMPAMKLILSRLKPGGLIQLRTNIESYATEARNSAAENWSLEPLVFRQVSKLEKPVSHFEKKYLARGETCIEFVCKKPSEPCGIK